MGVLATTHAKPCAWCAHGLSTRYVRYDGEMVCIDCHHRRRARRHTFLKLRRWGAMSLAVVGFSMATLAVLHAFESAHLGKGAPASQWAR